MSRKVRENSWNLIMTGEWPPCLLRVAAVHVRGKRWNLW